MSTRTIRRATPADYEAIIRAVDGWWGREVSLALPRYFLDHFHATSLVANERDAMTGFLVGFLSPSQPGQAYIHFVGVEPDHRRTGTARDLYKTFCRKAVEAACTVVHSITNPANKASISFHRHMGFAASEPIRNYNGPNRDMIVFTRRLAPGL